MDLRELVLRGVGVSPIADDHPLLKLLNSYPPLGDKDRKGLMKLDLHGCGVTENCAKRIGNRLKDANCRLQELDLGNFFYRTAEAPVQEGDQTAEDEGDTQASAPVNPTQSKTDSGKGPSSPPRRKSSSRQDSGRFFDPTWSADKDAVGSRRNYFGRDCKYIAEGLSMNL
jgi:hypothetical protein